MWVDDPGMATLTVTLFVSGLHLRHSSFQNECLYPDVETIAPENVLVTGDRYRRLATDVTLTVRNPTTTSVTAAVTLVPVPHPV